MTRMRGGQALGLRLRGPLVALGLVLVIGTLGYVAIEGWSIPDALYMVVITVTTVGYREVGPLSETGQWFTSGLAVVGLASTWYALSVMVALMVEGQPGLRWEQRRMERRIGHDRGHFVVCGFGRVGRQIAEELRREGHEVVVIDSAADALREAAADDFPTVAGDAAADDILRHAGIERAAGLITAVATDADNVFVTLSARALRPTLPIVARASSDDAIPKLHRAGATQVVSPYAMAGRQMARLALRPATVDFVETLLRGAGGDLLLEDVHVATDSPLAGVSIEEARRRYPDVTLFALQRDGTTIAPLAGDLTLAPGDILAAVGAEAALRELELASAAERSAGA
jgi:voltage-gated potassium channel